jgi:hypothetical protein
MALQAVQKVIITFKLFINSDSSFCKSCYLFRPSSNAPVCNLSWELNDLEVSNSIPEELSLSFMELQVIRQSHPFMNILIDHGRRQDKIKGQLVQVSASVDDKFNALLPASLNELPLLVTQLKPNETVEIASNNSKRFGPLSLQKVIKALTFLIQKNSLYSACSLRNLEEMKEMYNDPKSDDEININEYGYADLNQVFSEAVSLEENKRY